MRGKFFTAQAPRDFPQPTLLPRLSGFKSHFPPALEVAPGSAPRASRGERRGPQAVWGALRGQLPITTRRACRTRPGALGGLVLEYLPARTPASGSRQKQGDLVQGWRSPPPFARLPRSIHKLKGEQDLGERHGTARPSNPWHHSAHQGHALSPAEPDMWFPGGPHVNVPSAWLVGSQGLRSLALYQLRRLQGPRCSAGTWSPPRAHRMVTPS